MNQKWNLLIALVLCVAIGNVAQAQFIQRAVGGVSIDADGAVKDLVQQDAAKWAEELRQQLNGASQELKGTTPARHISLKKLVSAVAEANRTNTPLSEDMALMGGLTRIEYILVYPEQNDIVLVGPAEEWKVTDKGDIVGVKTGLPIMYVGDFLLAFSKINAPNPEVISCSIEPTPEGSEKLNQLLNQVKLQPGQSPTSFEPAMREAFGQQQVLFSGVNADTHLARVIFAADYQMKRIGMKLTDSPVKGLSSYVDMLRHVNNAPKNQSRWWMACNYAPIEKSEDSLVWKIQGDGIKVLTEEEVVQADGRRLGTGEKQELATKWADNFTSKIDQLAVAEPCIGQLRGIMDMCIAAAIIRTYGLEDVAQCDLSSIRSIKFESTEAMPAPKTVDPQCSFVKAGKSWIVTASGGVMVDPWASVREVKVSSKLVDVREKAKPQADSWTWN